MFCYSLRLTLALQLRSIQTPFFFFLSIIISIVKFYSFPPVPIFPGPFKCSGCITEVKLWSAGISILGVICWVTLLFPAL